MEVPCPTLGGPQLPRSGKHKAAYVGVDAGEGGGGGEAHASSRVGL